MLFLYAHNIIFVEYQCKIWLRLLGLVNYNRTGLSCCTPHSCFRDRLNKSVIPLPMRLK